MNLEVTFRNLRARDEVRRRAEALYQKLERFLDPAADGHLVFAVEHGSAVLELVITTRGDVHKVVEEDTDLRTALDRLFHTMEMQLRRGKERRIRRRHRAGERPEAFEAEPLGEEDDEEEEVAPL